MRRTLLITGALLLASSSAWAQTNGTVTLNGSVSSTLDMKYVSSTLQNGALEGSSQALNDPLQFVMNLGNVGDLSRGPAPIGGVVQVALRGNNSGAFHLDAQVTASSNMDSVGGAGVGLDDIGFGISAIDKGGANVGAGGADAAIATGYNYDPSTDLTGGTKTLNDLAASAVPVVASPTSGPISTGNGGLTDPTNAVYVDLSFGIEPKMYTPVGSFSAVVTFTLSDV